MSVRIIRYADAMTDAPSSVKMDDTFRVDGRWAPRTVRARMLEVVRAANGKLARHEHPVYAMGYEERVGDNWVMREVPWVTPREHTAHVQVDTDRPGVVTEALVIRTHSNAQGLGGRIEVFECDELAGWIVRCAPVNERGVVVGYTATYRVNNGQPDEFTIDNPSPLSLAKAALFDAAVRATVRRYRRWS